MEWDEVYLNGEKRLRNHSRGKQSEEVSLELE